MLFQVVLNVLSFVVGLHRQQIRCCCTIDSSRAPKSDETNGAVTKAPVTAPFVADDSWQLLGNVGNKPVNAVLSTEDPDEDELKGTDRKYELTDISSRLDDVRNMLRHVIKLHARKELVSAAESAVATEWCQAGRVLNRVFFLLYFILVLVGIVWLLPRPTW